jgi:hypothetical protein
VQPAARRVARDARAVNAAAYDEQIDLMRGHGGIVRP